MLSALNMLGSTMLKICITKIVFNELYKTFFEIDLSFFYYNLRFTVIVRSVLKILITHSWFEEV